MNNSLYPYYNFDMGILGHVKINGPITSIQKPIDILWFALGILVWLIGVLAVVAIIYSGIMYITAGGDENKAETAKKNIIWAIIGVVLVICAQVFISWIPKFFTP